MVIDLDKTGPKIKAVAAILGLVGIANFGDMVRLVRSFFGRGVEAAPALVAEIKARKDGDSVISGQVDTVRYELKRVKIQNIRFQAAQVAADPKLREALERANSENRAARASRAQTMELLEGLGDTPSFR